jgi:thioredoxin reductase
VQEDAERDTPDRGTGAPTEVLVLGGGFAGLQVVRKLANTPVHVTIVDQHNFHTFLPLLYQVATAGLEPADVAYPIRTIFGKSTNVTFRHGRASSVDHGRQVVTLRNGDELAYDHLVLACGATAAFFSIPGAEEHAMPLYTLADARGLRNHLLLTLEEADARGTGRASPLTFVVVGGGPTGVETAGAVLELLEVCIRRDRLRIDVATTKVILLDVAPRLLNGFPRSASSYAERALEKKGVEIRLGESVVEVSPECVTLASGEQIATRTVVWAAGVTAAGTMADHSGAAPGPIGPGVRHGGSLCRGACQCLGCRRWGGGADREGRRHLSTACARRDPVRAPLRSADTQRHRGPANGSLRLQEQGDHGHDRQAVRRCETALRARDQGNDGVARVDEPPPLLSRGLPEPAPGLHQLDMAVLRLAVGTSPHHGRC